MSGEDSAVGALGLNQSTSRDSPEAIVDERFALMEVAAKICQILTRVILIVNTCSARSARKRLKAVTGSPGSATASGWLRSAVRYVRRRSRTPRTPTFD